MDDGDGSKVGPGREENGPMAAWTCLLPTAPRQLPAGIRGDLLQVAIGGESTEKRTLDYYQKNIIRINN